MAKLNRREAYRQRVFRVYTTIYERSKAKKSSSTKYLAARHRKAPSTIRRYIHEMQKQNMPIEYNVNTRKWAYFNPEKRLKERDTRVMENRRDIEDEHKRILREGGSQIIDDIEKYYRTDYRGNVANKIQRISSLSLSQEERDHIKRHLGLI